MWYLRTDTLLIMVGMAAFWGILQRVSGTRRVTPWFLVGDLALIVYVSRYLALFYVLYTVISFAFVKLLRRATRCRRVMFVAFCAADVLPFILTRVPALTVSGIALVGFAYNMLKSVDALFYVYYSRRDITFIKYSNFILYFPVFTAGPIFRYRDFSRYYDAPEPPDAEAVTAGVKRVIMGLFKKAAVVVWLQWALGRILGYGTHFWTSLGAALVSYALLYCDLSGYSDIAVGLGAIAGLPVPENFKNPLSSPSFTQFWRRWHVTLSDWIREHIFVALNGRRLTRWVSALVGLVTMIVMSLWHSFTVTALVDGVYMGTFLVIENLFGLTTYSGRRGNRWIYRIRCLLVTVFFGINALFFTVDGASLAEILRGFISL